MEHSLRKIKFCAIKRQTVLIWVPVGRGLGTMARPGFHEGPLQSESIQERVTRTVRDGNMRRAEVSDMLSMHKRKHRRYMTVNCLQIFGMSHEKRRYVVCPRKSSGCRWDEGSFILTWGTFTNCTAQPKDGLPCPYMANNGHSSTSRVTCKSGDQQSGSPWETLLQL